MTALDAEALLEAFESLRIRVSDNGYTAARQEQLRALRAELLRRLVRTDRWEFTALNAPALVESLEARVARQTAELARLNQSLAAVRAERDRLLKGLRSMVVQAQQLIRERGHPV
jgi:uncharacterized coiled-coil protein SlyX